MYAKFSILKINKLIINIIILQSGEKVSQK